ncbi:MAG: hypothetical protein RR705_09340 [Lachnospiraceae bacterium]
MAALISQIQMKRKYAKLTGIVLLLLIVHSSFAQKARGFDLDASILYSDLEEPISFGVAGKYNVWLNPYFAVSLGGRLTYSRLQLGFDSPSDERVSYYIDDNNLLNLNGDLGVKSVTPTYKGIGLFADLSFLFDPIPVNVVSIDKRVSYPMEEVKSKNKMVYTHFNPSYSLKLGVFYQLKTGGQIAIGGEITSFNPYNVYYQTTIDAIKLNQYLKLAPDKQTYSVFIRISGLKFN